MAYQMGESGESDHDPCGTQSTKFMNLIPHILQALGLEIIDGQGARRLLGMDGEKVRAVHVSLTLRLIRPKKPNT
jgi:hypothetical protein